MLRNTYHLVDDANETPPTPKTFFSNSENELIVAEIAILKIPVFCGYNEADFTQILDQMSELDLNFKNVNDS